MSKPIRSARFLAATHAVSSTQARHNRVAQLVCTLLRPAPANVGVRQHLFSQALSIITRSRIARHGYSAPCVDELTCVAVMYLTLRTGCERYGRKNPLPYSFSERSHIGNLRQIRKQGKGRSSKRKENRRLSFLFAPAAGRGTLPPSADGKSPAESQRKTSRPERAYCRRNSRAPESRCS